MTQGFLTYKTVGSCGALHYTREPRERIQFDKEGQKFGLRYTVAVEHRCQVDC